MIRKFLASFRGAAADRKGVTAAEYAVLAVGVIIVVGAGVGLFGGNLRSAFVEIGTQITAAQASATSAATR